MEGYFTVQRLDFHQAAELLMVNAPGPHRDNSSRLSATRTKAPPARRVAVAQLSHIRHAYPGGTFTTLNGGRSDSKEHKSSISREWLDSSHTGVCMCKNLGTEESDAELTKSRSGILNDIRTLDLSRMRITQIYASWQADPAEESYGGWSLPIHLDNSSVQCATTAGLPERAAPILLALAVAIHGYGVRGLPRQAMQLQPWASLSTATSFEAWGPAADHSVTKQVIASNLHIDPTPETVSLAERQDILSKTPSEPSSTTPQPSGGGRSGVGRVVVPSVVDPAQERAVEALQALQVIEETIDPAGLCSRREYARWLVSGSSALSRSSADRVFPAMYVEGITELAFDDVLPDDPDFPSIQGLAEAGLISSRLSRSDLGCNLHALKSGCSQASGNLFRPDSPLCRQDLISWKVMLEQRHLPLPNPEVVKELSGFIDVDRIDRDALPAVAYDLGTGYKSLISAAFGYTRRFEPTKPVTRAQAACTLALGNSAEIVGEELERLDAERLAEEAVEVAEEVEAQEVEREWRGEGTAATAMSEELMAERERRLDAESATEAALIEVEQARAARQKDGENIAQVKAVVEAERELLIRIRQQAEDQLAGLASSRQEIEMEKQRLAALCSRAEAEKQATEEARIQVEVEKKAFTIARSWADEEASKARQEAKQLRALRKRIKTQQEAASTNAQKIFEDKLLSLSKTRAFPSRVGVHSNDATHDEAQNSFRSNLGQMIERAGVAAKEVKKCASNTVQAVSQTAKTSVSDVMAAWSEGARECNSSLRKGVTSLTNRLNTPPSAQ